jgi:DNA helicase INO80
LTARQKAFYRGLKEKISISELLEKATSLSDLENMDSLMNLVMQFRKVCNHPELFERADVESPLSFCEFSQSGSLSKETLLYCPYSSRNPIKFQIPKKLYRNGGILKQVGPHSRRGFELRYVNNELNIWNDQYIHENSGSSFSFLQFCQTSSHEASYLFKANLVHRWIAALAKRAQHALLNYTQSETWALPDRPTSPFAITHGSAMEELTNLSDNMVYDAHLYGQCYLPPVSFISLYKKKKVSNDSEYRQTQYQLK